MIVESFHGMKYNFRAKAVTRMKKFSVLITFLVAVMISSTALAANWVVVDSSNENGVLSSISVDKDSIKRGIESKKFNYSRSDGFSANVKIVMEVQGQPFTMIMSTGFFEENGAKKYCVFEIYEENGNLSAGTPDKIEIANADGSEGTIWPTVWAYVEKNLP